MVCAVTGNGVENRTAINWIFKSVRYLCVKGYTENLVFKIFWFSTLTLFWVIPLSAGLRGDEFLGKFFEFIFREGFTCLKGKFNRVLWHPNNQLGFCVFVFDLVLVLQFNKVELNRRHCFESMGVG